jgi:hypothetical protein
MISGFPPPLPAQSFPIHRSRHRRLDLTASLSNELMKEAALYVKREVSSVWTELKAGWILQVNASSKATLYHVRW